MNSQPSPEHVAVSDFRALFFAGLVCRSITHSDPSRRSGTVFRRPDGGLYAEELMGHEGFVGTSSLLYHTYPPTTVKSARKLRDVRWKATRTRRSAIAIS